MKKAIILITATIIILSFTACYNAAVQETTEKETTEATLPEVTDVTTPPEETPIPTPYVFDVDDVKMQSTPGSSCFSEIGYDSYWEILVVQFRDGGSVYAYLDFPIGEWDKLTSAGSLGSWYNKYIKGKYEYERIR